MKKLLLLTLPALFLLITVYSVAQDPPSCEFSCGKYTQKSPVPNSDGIRHPSVAEIGGKIYMTNSHDFDSTNALYYDTLYMYDPATDQWSNSLAPIPFPRLGLGGSCVVDGKWYIPGGATVEPRNPSDPNTGYDATPYARHDVYDPATDSWDMKANLPEPLGYSACAVVDGKIYVTGGATTNYKIRRSVYMYDPATDQWSQKADMERPRWDHICVAAAGKIYVIGGRTSTSFLVSFSGEVYDPATDQWSPITTPPSDAGLWYHRGFVVDGEIYLSGGTSNGNGTSFPKNLYKYVPATGQWVNAGKVQKELGWHGVVAIGRTIYNIGGLTLDNLKAISDTHEVTELELSDITLDSMISILMVSEALEIDLSDYFRHIDGEPISYRICMESYDEENVSASVSGSILTLIPQNKGFAHISTLAESGEDRMGLKITTMLVVDVPSSLEIATPRLQVYPNPSSGMTTLTYTLQVAGEVQLHVYDMVGKRLSTLIHESRPAGSHETSWNTSDLIPGVYFCELITPGSRATVKVMVE